MSGACASAGCSTRLICEFLVSIARQAAIAIESARLYLETQRRASEMAALAEVGRDISATLELSAVLERITIHAQELLNADSSAVFLRGERASRHLHRHCGRRRYRRGTKEPRKSLMGRASWAISPAKGRPKWSMIPTMTRAAITIAGTEDQEHEHMMVAPLLAADGVRGLMSVWRTGQGREFEQEELNFLEWSLAAGGRRHRKCAPVQRSAGSEAVGRGSEPGQERLPGHDEPRAAHAAERDHRLHAHCAAARRKGKLPERQLDNLDKVLSSAEHLLGLINTILDIAKIEAGRMDVTPHRI